MHDHPTVGHFRIDGMFRKIKETYYWPQMYESISTYVQSCDNCQHRGRKKSNSPLQPIPVGPLFQKIGIDIVGPLLLTTQGIDT